MSHKQKISTTSKTGYFLVIAAGILMAILFVYSLFVGLRINIVYTSLLNSSIEIKNHIATARFEFLKSIDSPSDETFKRAIQSLDLAEIKTQAMLQSQENLSILLIPDSNVKLAHEVQQLQKLLLEYRGLAKEIKPGEKVEISAETKIQWEFLYSSMDDQRTAVENEINMAQKFYLKIFRIMQYVLIALSIIMCAFTITVMLSSEKQKRLFKKQLEFSVHEAQVGMHKTTKFEKALTESRRKLDTLVGNLPGMVYSCKVGQVWEMDYVSDKCLHVTGYKADELMNKTVLYYDELINKDDRKKVLEQIHQAVEEKRPYQLVYRIKTAVGYEKWVWEQGVGVFSDNEDELVAIEGFITDITEQKSVEEQLSLQSNALEAAANGILITDREGVIVWVNSAFTNLTGYSAKDVVGKKPNILKSGIHDQTFYSYLWGKITIGEIWRGEITNKRKDGSVYSEEMIITPITNPIGEVTNFVAIKQDITERKKAEESLRDSELRFRGLYENATIGIYRSTPQGKILLANPTLLNIAGYKSFEDFSRVNADDTYADAKSREFFKNELSKKGRIFGFESKWKKADGTVIYIRESARAVKDEAGNDIFYEGTVEDITDKKKIEEELITAKDRAEMSDKLKSEFLAQMSHEIRTPLNVILSFTGMMKDELQDKVDPEMANGFDVIDQEGKRIMRTVELILNMSELQTGSYSYRPKRIDLIKDIISKHHSNFVAIADQKKVLLKINNLTSDTIIEADEYSTNQIFHHLLDNALKFTQKGKVEVTINRDPRNNLYVDVADTGVGIAEEYMPMLFQPFSKEEKGYTRNFEGNGLGLALVKKYCELNRADIKVSSIKSKGSTFRVTFHSLN